MIVKQEGELGDDAGVGTRVTRRFPAPWSVRELEQAFRIEDATG